MTNLLEFHRPGHPWPAEQPCFIRVDDGTRIYADGRRELSGGTPIDSGYSDDEPLDPKQLAAALRAHRMIRLSYWFERIGWWLGWCAVAVMFVIAIVWGKP